MYLVNQLDLSTCSRCPALSLSWDLLCSASFFPICFPDLSQINNFVVIAVYQVSSKKETIFPQFRDYYAFWCYWDCYLLHCHITRYLTSYLVWLKYRCTYYGIRSCGSLICYVANWFCISTDYLVVLETGVTQFFKKLDIGTFDLGDYLGNALTNVFMLVLLCFIGFLFQDP